MAPAPHIFVFRLVLTLLAGATLLSACDSSKSEEEESTIASLSRTDDHELTRLVNEIDGNNHTQGDPKVRSSAGGGIATATLAELYQKQGFVQRAIETYRQLLERDPDNTEYEHKIGELSG